MSPFLVVTIILVAVGPPPQAVVQVREVAVVPGNISGIILLGLLRGKDTPGMFDPVL
jgi:hypothetical protein